MMQTSLLKPGLSISHQENTQKAENYSPNQYSHRYHSGPMTAFRLLLLFVSHFPLLIEVASPKCLLMHQDYRVVLGTGNGALLQGLYL
jgi:hypothetical protein